MTHALMRGSLLFLRAGALLPWLGLTAAVGAAVILLELISAFYASTVFVLLAPLLPIAGLGLSYVPSVNAEYQLIVASPYSTMRLLLGRGLVFLALATPVVLFCGCRLGGVQFGTRMLVHAAAVDAVGLAQSTVMAPTLSAAMVALAWLGLFQVVLMAGRLADITSSRAITVAVCIAVAALFVFILRRREVSTDWRYS
jgi:hypothetical protein